MTFSSDRIGRPDCENQAPVVGAVVKGGSSEDERMGSCDALNFDDESQHEQPLGRAAQPWQAKGRHRALLDLP
jgi:hypothetical protein